jgi:hypothetical protein
VFTFRAGPVRLRLAREVLPSEHYERRQEDTGP